MANVLLVTKGTGGYLSPFLAMGDTLKERGHAVTLLTHSHYADAANQADLDFVALDTPDEFERFIEDGHLLNAVQDVPVFFEKHVLPRIQPEVAQIEERCTSEQTVLVAAHMSDIAARFASEKLGVPLVQVFMAPVQAAGVSLLGDLCSRALGPAINQSRAETGLLPVDDWHSWLQYAERSIGLWPDWFGCPEPGWPLSVTLTGFLWYDDANTVGMPQSIQGALLDCDEQAVLITGGTGMFGGDEFFSASAEACQLLGCPGLLLTRQQNLVPRRLPENVTWVKQVPSLVGLMPHVRAIIHHGGMGTLSQALYAGIPQLVLAAGGDRTDNAARLQNLGVAEFLRPPQWRAELVAEALYQITHAPTVQERCKEVAGWLRDTDSAAAVCDVIEETLSGGCLRDHVTAAPVASKVAAVEVSGKTGNLPDGLADLSAERRALIALRLGKSQDEKRG